MSIKHVQSQLADAYSLLDVSEKILDSTNSISVARLFETLNYVKKNIRDAKKLINSAEGELDDIVREIDEHDVEFDEEVF